jgi:predicted aspartyl protease
MPLLFSRIARSVIPVILPFSVMMGCVGTMVKPLEKSGGFYADLSEIPREISQSINSLYSETKIVLNDVEVFEWKDESRSLLPIIEFKVGNRVVRALVDTGATFSLIPNKGVMADLLDKQSLVSVPKKKTQWGKIPQLEIGQLIVQDLAVMIDNLVFEHTGHLFDMIIGQEFLRHVDVFFDYEKRAIGFKNPSAREYYGSNILPLKFDSYSGIWHTTVLFEGSKCDKALIDTGFSYVHGKEVRILGEWVVENENSPATAPRHGILELGGHKMRVDVDHGIQVLGKRCMIVGTGALLKRPFLVSLKNQLAHWY